MRTKLTRLLKSKDKNDIEYIYKLILNMDIYTTLRDIVVKTSNQELGTNTSSYHSDIGQLDMTPITTSVFICGPSAVGKSTILAKIAKKYSDANVCAIGFDKLFKYYNNDAKRAAHHIVNYRTEPMIYEHSKECTQLYEVIHKFMPTPITEESLRSCYNRCLDMLTTRSLKDYIVILDLTTHYFDRYYNRLINNYNGIDYNNDSYLYYQMVAYLAMIKQKHLFPSAHIYIVCDDTTQSLRYGICKIISDATNKTNKDLNINIVDHISKLDTIVDLAYNNHLSYDMFAGRFD